jgi:hypothetical protein
MPFIPQVNYTDWSTATSRRILVPIFVDGGGGLPPHGGSRTAINLGFLDRSSHFFFKYLLICAHEG